MTWLSKTMFLVGWMEVKVVLRIAYSNQKWYSEYHTFLSESSPNCFAFFDSKLSCLCLIIFTYFIQKILVLKILICFTFFILWYFFLPSVKLHQPSSFNFIGLQRAQLRMMQPWLFITLCICSDMSSIKKQTLHGAKAGIFSVDLSVHSLLVLPFELSYIDS